MLGAIGVAGEVAGAAAALAGLTLVFLGAVASSYESYQKTEQRAVRALYQRRAWFAFIGFVFALLSVALGLVGKWLLIEWPARVALAFLALSLIWVLFAALFSVLEIK